MPTALLCVCVCVCLLSTALSTPVPPPLPGRAGGNCVGQHRILLKGCNAKHGFYVFKYVYSFSTRRNQTQIKREEADSQSVDTGRQLGDDNARLGPMEDGAAPEQGDDDSTDVTENGTGLKPQNRSAPGVGGNALSPRPGTGTRARGGVGVAGPTPASSEGSGDVDLVVEVHGGVSTFPQGPGEAVAGNRSEVRSEDQDDGAPRGIPVEGAMTAGRERASTAGGAGDEGSGEATVPGQGREGITWGTGTGGAALSSVTKMEDVQVDAKGVDEYAYIPDSGSVTVTHGKVGSTVGATSFTQISPDTDDEVNIFIERANIRVGEQENAQAGTTVGSENEDISTAETSTPLPRAGVTAAHDSSDDDGIPAHRQPEVLATTATPRHRDSTTSSPGDGHPTGDNEDGAATVGDGEGPVSPSPRKVTGGEGTIPMEAGIREKGDDEARGEGQRSEERLGHLAVTTPHQGGEKGAPATVPAKGASIHLGTTVASPKVSEVNCITTLGMASGHKAGESAVAGRGGSREGGPATPQPPRERWPGVGTRARLGGAGMEKIPKVDKAPPPRRKAGSQASSGAQVSAGSHGGDSAGRSRTTKAGGSPPPQAGQAGASVAAGKGQEWGGGVKTGVAAAGDGGGRLPGRHGRRPGAGAPGAFTALGQSRQLDQVKRANELHIQERSFYALGRVAGGPRGPYAGPGSADSSQSSEGERGSHSDSRQTGLQTLGWGAPGHPHGLWRQGIL